MTKLGIQLILFGRRSGEDLPGVLRDVARAGYDGAEIGNPTDTKPATALRSIFDAAELACAGYHTGVHVLADSALVSRTAAHMEIVGARHLMAGIKPPDRAGYERAARILNEAARILDDHGIRLCYHNHHWEFDDLADGVCGMDVLLEQTDPARVGFCFDLYWIACAGRDPAAFLQQHGARTDYLHFKDGTFADGKPLLFLEMGRGQVDLKACAEVARTLTPSWIVVEQDRPNDRDPADCARISVDYARSVLGF
jgi:sugar phosphate isomerase/epimerase